ncbi:DUF397 domain-containing protein [Nocardiopsis alba]|uniref:DUF397 domain-containing protein n=1 Tax=Nocardiopsis alba TaxID=53437 RepID=UPI0033A434F2
MGADPRRIDRDHEESTESARIGTRKGLTGKWEKSSYSGASGACVEAAWHAPRHVAIRDSQNPELGDLTLSPTAWLALLAVETKK